MPQPIERNAIRYRPDIDGLRALAVLPVVLYHFQIWPFTGGFVGVDIFFVISGYLITSLIHGEMEQGRFSVVHFYERRIRRIFPALFAVIAASCIAAAILLFPIDLIRFGHSVMATVVFGSNFLFKNAAGYFDTVAERKPLLHTWSLAVEEQFYVLFPAMLYFLRRAGQRAQFWVIAAILVASLALAIHQVPSAPETAFYLLPDRAWELMLGAILAIGNFPLPSQRLLREVLALIGVALIAFAVLTYNTETLFPGWTAIPPCLGAALLIYAGSGGTSVIGATLGSAPLVGIGLISYSFYLWHWPLRVFGQYALFRPLMLWEKAALIAVSALLAYLSWRFVERPFRGRGEFFSRKMIFTLAAIASAVLFAAGYAATLDHGLTFRYPKNVQLILKQAIRKPPPKQDACFGKPLFKSKDGLICTFGAQDAKPSFAFWGDSHATMLLPVIGDRALATHRQGLFIKHGACRPALGVESSRSGDCDKVNRKGLAAIEATPSIGEVILAGRWAMSADGRPAPHEDGATEYVTDKDHKTHSLAANPIVFANGLDALVAKLTADHKKVVIVSSVPEIGWPVPETLARIAVSHSALDIRPTVAQFRARQAAVLKTFADLHRKYGATIVYPDSILCAGGYCMVESNGLPIYTDPDHLTQAGARLLAPLLDPLL
ncbi:MAG: acyltransferase family protein [Rhizomicrobium sp.]